MVPTRSMASLSRAPRGSPTGSAPSQSTPSAAPTTVSNNIMKKYEDIVKPQEDKREYRGLQLSNNLKILLVSDPSTDKSAAALDVNVGYMSDPEELPGLAHFCEHMLFLGTEKYPEENEYSKFLSEHGGSSNAATSSDHTTYYFDVVPAKLTTALDIFAQFFISPLFTEGATDRELNAVHSEHEKNVQLDSWRLDQLNKSTCDPGHAFHKFGTGNKDTLDVLPKSKGINVRQELLKFHSTWYSSNIMSLMVVGKESLDELESMVVPLFSQVKDRSVTSPTWPDHPYPPELRRRVAYCVPVKDIRNLSIDFPVPDSRKYYKSGPGHYLSHLIGHEGPGSLLSALKTKGWCNRVPSGRPSLPRLAGGICEAIPNDWPVLLSLVGGTRIGARGFGFFGVQVDLTEEGLDHVDDIVKMVFQYIEMVRAQGPQRWVWEEQRDLMAMEFRFKDVSEPRSLVAGYVHLLQAFPMEDVLSAFYLMTEWRPDLIEKLLACLTPENVRIAVVSKSFTERCTQVEPWYGTKYLEEVIPDSKIKAWKSSGLNPDLIMPPPNEFIPSKLHMESMEDENASQAPSIVKDTSLLRLWFKQDNEFMLPKAFATFDLVSPQAYSDPLNCNLASVWVLLLRDSLQQYAYSAELAGLRWNIGMAKQGLLVSIEGYDDKQHVLLEKLINQIVNFETDPARFDIMKEIHIRSIKNFDAEQPYQHAVYQQALCLSDEVWTKCQLLEAAERLTPQLLDDFARRFVRRVHIEGLMFGNMTKERALSIADRIENMLPKDGVPLLAQQLLLHREIELEKGTEYLREVENSVHKSSCASIYYPCGIRDTRSNVILEMMAQILSEPCFNILRTKEQLGYIVFSGLRRSNGVQGLRMIVQSDRHPAYLEQRIEAFLKQMESHIQNMSEEEFENNKAALAARKLERPKRLQSKASLVWSEISAQLYNFDRQRIEVDQLKLLTKDEILQEYKKYICEGSSERRKISVFVISTAEGGAGNEETTSEATDSKIKTKATLISDLIDFKSRRTLYPQPTPFVNIPRKGAHCKL